MLSSVKQNFTDIAEHKEHQGTFRSVMSVMLQHCWDNLGGLSRCGSSGQVCQQGPRKGREGVREAKKHDRI